MKTVSLVFWIVWILAGTGFELFALATRSRWGSVPLTGVILPLMLDFWPVKLAVLTFLSWLALHFFTQVKW